MKSNKKIDFKSIKRMLKIQIKKKIKNVVILGTTGESSTINFKEHIKILKFVKKNVKNKINIISGSCSNSTQDSLHINKNINKLKIKAILQVVPYYNIPNQIGIYKHFNIIEKNSKIPIIIYNIPNRTNCNIEESTISKLYKKDRIIGIKYSSKDFHKIINIIRRFKYKKFKLYCGDDIFFHINYLLGASGNISVASNIIPDEMNDIYDDINKKKIFIDKINNKYKKIFKIIKTLSIEINPIPVKYILSKLKIIKNNLRLPLTRLKNKNKKIINGVFKENKKFEKYF